MKGPAELFFMSKGLAVARLKVEFIYYKLASDLQELVSIWDLEVGSVDYFCIDILMVIIDNIFL